MDPQRRREQLLEVAGAYVGAHGVEVSLDDIAHEAGISPPLMRHYFGNREGLIFALAERAVQDLEGIYLVERGGDLGERLARHLGWVVRQQWAHRLWLEGPPAGSGPDFAPTRRRMMEVAAAVPWAGLDTVSRVRAAAWIAAVEASVTQWLAEGEPSRDELVGILLDLAVRLEVAGARRARDRVRKAAA